MNTLILQAQELDGIKIIRYEESIYYANVDNFKYRIVKAVGIDPKDVNHKIAQIEKRVKNKKGVSENFLTVISFST